MKETKKALIASGMSLVLCFVLMAGMTFAWFTDSIINQGNFITTGTLTVDLLMDKEKNGTYTSVANVNENAEKIFSDEVGQNGYNWEPGKTEIVYLAVKNNGQLNLKYNLDMDITGDLAPALEYALIPDANKDSLINTWEDAINYTDAETGNAGNDISFGEDKVVKANQTGDAMSYFALAIHMKEDKSNDVQGKFAKINIEVKATQMTGEKDGFGKDNYDESAVVATAVDLKNALANGGIVSLSDDVIVTGEGKDFANIISGNTTVNFGSKKIKLEIPNAVNDTENWKGLVIENGNVTLNGTTGGVETSPNSWLYAVYVSGGAKVIINGGSYIGGTTAVNVLKGSVEINGGFFKGRALGDDGREEFSPFTINCSDNNYKNGSASIIVKGGTFVNFNPADNGCEGPNTNYVAEGYKVISEEQANGEIWYTVVKK